MEKRLPHKITLSLNGPVPFTLLFILCGFTCASNNRVVVPEKVTAVLGKNITLGCRIEVGSNLTQSSWERHLPSGAITIAVFNPEFGISVSQEYAKRVSFLSPSVHDATILLEGVGFADVGSYTCKVSTFPLGNTQASTTVNVLVEPKVYVSAGPAPLLDGDPESVVATCVAERGRPAATVSWEAPLDGRSEPAVQDEANGTTTVQAHYVWRPQSHAQGQGLTCVVRHPALATDFRIPFTISVQFAPEVSIVGDDKNWYVGQKDVRLDCGAKANPPARHFTWMRMDGPMPDGVELSNNSVVFARPLDRNDSGVYRCEVMNDIGLRSRDVHLWIQDPPPTTAAPTTAASLHRDTAGTSAAGDRRRAQFTSPTLASLPDSSLGTIVGGAVGGVLFLALLLILGTACFMRQRRTFRGDYYTKQYLGPSDMQKESQLDVLQPHELQEVYGDKGGGGGGKGSSLDLKPKPGGDVIYPEYPSERKDRDDWGGERAGDGHAEDGYYPEHYKNSHNVHPCGPPVHSSTVNGSPYLPEDCYDNGTDSDYVSHMDGSVISRRECSEDVDHHRKQDADSGVGSDNGDKRLSATEPSDEESLSLTVAMTNITEEGVSQQDSSEHINTLTADCEAVQLIEESPTEALREHFGRDYRDAGLTARFLNYIKGRTVTDFDEPLRIDEDTNWPTAQTSKVAGGTELHIDMINQLKEAVELLQDPNRGSLEQDGVSGVQLYPVEMVTVDDSLNGQESDEGSTTPKLPAAEACEFQQRRQMILEKAHFEAQLACRQYEWHMSIKEGEMGSPLCERTRSSTPPFGLKPRSAPPSLPCSPPPSCLRPLFSQAPPSNRDTPRSHDDGGMTSCVFLRSQKSLDAVDPQFTMRRKMEQLREELELLETLRDGIEGRLKVVLPEDLGSSLMDGVVLCHLANHIRPRSVASIHVPSPAVPKLSMAKCRRNVENFLDACRKIGVSEDKLCLPHHILEERGLIRVCATVQALLDHNPTKQTLLT